ncbi:MAG: peptidoglycan-binding domain-containing protein [bacterium]
MKKFYTFLALFLTAAILFAGNSYAATKVVAKIKPAARIVKPSLSPATIKAVQEKLSKIGLYKGKVDGMIGKNTISAVKVFQKKKGLKVDGIIGPLTLKALDIK